MNVRFDGAERTGDAVDLREWSVTATHVADAMYGNGSVVDVSCPEPGMVHRYVGVISPEMDVQLRAALAAAARSRGKTAPQDDALRAVRAKLAAVTPQDVNLTELRAAVADAGTDAETLRERVATLQGRVQALREAGEGAEAEAELARVQRRLSEVETERIAAEQRLERGRRTARRARDERMRRLRLEDRAAALERDARAHLAAAVHGEFAAAVEAVPGPGSAGEPPDGFDGDGTTAALAIARIAALDAPVVLDCDRFETAAEASACLDAPVVRL